ncbi:MAG: 3D domain-containing protein [Clostridiales bacterium]|jgi:3D (Asp-Asp-Asp) domain-containing protein/cell division protein FtsB|nr:3D domain-containing protein [Eubacteriales bacterium]MDH7564949.1 3D domain-containing protein [Clostridiales bacterium]
MYNHEAASSPEPRNTIGNEYTSLKKNNKGYFFTVCILFIVTAALYANNFLVYKSYRELKNQFEITTSKYKSLTVNNTDLNVENSRLKKENEELKQNYNRIISRNEEIIKQIEAIQKKNDELVKRNRELVEDNIALQNSVKMAASVGIKPQNYSKFQGISSRGELQRGTYLGKFLGTAYTPSKEECGNSKGITNSGEPIIPGISIAIDNKYWPFGTVFYIKGLGYAVAMDTGSAIKGKYRFDFAVFDKKFAKALGSREWDVYLVKEGKGYVESTVF